MQAFIWDSEHGARVITPEWTGGKARDINDAGVVVGFGRPTATKHAFWWDGSVHDLGVPAGWANSEAHGINELGVVVGQGNTIGGQRRTFVWDVTSGFQDIGMPGGWSTIHGHAINDSSWVVGFGQAGSDTHAFAWTPDAGFLDISPPGWQESYARCINNGRWVTLHGVDGDGKERIALAHVTPELPCGGLLLVGAIPLAIARLRGRRQTG